MMAVCRFNMYRDGFLELYLSGLGNVAAISAQLARVSFSAGRPKCCYAGGFIELDCSYNSLYIALFFEIFC